MITGAGQKLINGRCNDPSCCSPEWDITYCSPMLQAEHRAATQRLFSGLLLPIAALVILLWLLVGTTPLSVMVVAPILLVAVSATGFWNAARTLRKAKIDAIKRKMLDATGGV